MKNHTLIDITLPIDERLAVYPGDPRPEVRRLSSIEHGDALTASELRIGCHLGSHVDAPAHFLRGAPQVAQLPLEHFYGEAVVLDCTAANVVDVDTVAAFRPARGVHLLLKTNNSLALQKPDYREDHCFLTPRAIGELLSWEPLSIGFDYYSLDRSGDHSFPVHRAVAARGLPAFVCLNLLDVAPGEYELCALPWNIPGLDGIPVRAVLFR